MARMEDQYRDVLQNMEFAIVSTYREHPGMSDYDVLRVIDAVVDAYRAQNIGREPRDFALSQTEQICLDRLRQTCDWRLGRTKLGEDDDQPQPQPKTLDEILLCLKRIAKSVKHWNHQAGPQGYLNFVAKFVV